MVNQYSDELLRAIDEDNLDKVQRLLDAGADVNAIGPGRLTPLLAAIGANLEIVRLLISRGADVNRAGTHGHTPLHLAVDAMVNDTIANGDRQDASSTRIDWSLVRTLLDAGADPLQKDDDGETPIDWLRPYGLKKEEVEAIMIQRHFPSE